MAEVYHDLLKSWEDIQDEFRMTEKTPDQVLYANYSYESYSGDAFVAYRNGDDFYTVDGGHCSCYGLEGQWEPEHYTREEFMALVERNTTKKDGYEYSTANKTTTWWIIKENLK